MLVGMKGFSFPGEEMIFTFEIASTISAGNVFAATILFRILVASFTNVYSESTVFFNVRNYFEFSYFITEDNIYI